MFLLVDVERFGGGDPSRNEDALTTFAALVKIQRGLMELKYLSPNTSPRFQCLI